MARLAARRVSLVLLLCVIASLLQVPLVAQGQEATQDAVAEEIVSRRTENSKVFRENDGSFTAKLFPGPIHFQDASGQWLDIDTTLVPSVDPDFGWQNAAGRFTVRFSTTARSTDMVSIAQEGKSVRFGLQGASTDSVGVVDGNAITYPNVMPGVDLRYEVKNEGVKELLVLTAPPAAGAVMDFDFPLALSGLSATETTQGGLELSSASSGELVFTVPHLFMYDSAVDPASGDSAFSEDVAVDLQGSGADLVAHVSPSAAWLQDPARQYPVVIDPAFWNQNPSLDTYVQSNITSSPQNGMDELKSGTYDGSVRAKSLLKFDLSAIPNNSTINSATLSPFNFHSYSCSARSVEVYRITESWGSGAVWPGPAFAASPAHSVNTANGHSSSCPSARVSFNVQSIVQYWKNSSANNDGFGIRAANMDDVYGWKKFRSNESSYPVNLDVNWTEPDTTAPEVTNLASSSHPAGSGSWASTTSGSFSWSGSDASGIAGYSYLRDQSSGTTPDTISEGTGTTATYSGLAQGMHYFHVRAKDGAGNWGLPKQYAFGIDTVNPSDPGISSSTHTRDACSTSRSPSFSWSSSDSTSGVAGYGYVFDQSGTTIPDTSNVSTTTSGTFSAPTDGDWWLHVRGKDRAANLSSTMRFKVRINATLASPPSITTSSHTEGAWSTNRNFSIGWSLSDYFGISGYSYILDQSSGTIPDTTSEGTGTSYSTSGLGDGTHYFHVRALDGCGSWGETRHFTVRVDATQSSVPGVSSPSHPSDSTWYSSRAPQFNFPVTDTSGIDGYSYLIDGALATTPDTISEGGSSTYTASGLTDGTHHFHVRARNGSGLWSDAGHRAVKIDGTAPAEPGVSSSTHPVASTDYPSNDPVLSWTAPSDLSGIAGYSYVLDQALSTTPDTTSEGTAMTKSYTDLADGTYYFHVRARDVAGNWGPATHRRIGVRVPAPAVSPTLNAPGGQVDPEGRPVVKNGDVLTFGGDITEGSGPGASLDSVAKITSCDLVVSNSAGTVTSRIAVPLTSCRNDGGKLSGSYAPTSFGVTNGTVKLEVVATRTEGAITKTSGTQASAPVQVDNDPPAIAAASIGCDYDVIITCNPYTTIQVGLSEPVRGEFRLTDFTITGNQVVAVTSVCSESTSCSELELTLGQALDEVDLPSLSYAFDGTLTRPRPHDGAGNMIPAKSLPVSDGDDDVDAEVQLDPFLDPNEPAVELPLTPPGQVLVLDANIQQVHADNAPVDCTFIPFDSDDPATQDRYKRNKDCNANGNEGREEIFARRITNLILDATSSERSPDKDAVPYVPDVILLQESRRVDAQNVMRYLNGKINVRNSANELVSDVFQVGKASNKVDTTAVPDGPDDDKAVEAILRRDNAILYNKVTMARLLFPNAKRDMGSFVDSTYSRAEQVSGDACKNPDGTDKGLVDFDLDGVNDCKTRTYKRQFVLGLQEREAVTGATQAKVAVASVHLPLGAQLDPATSAPGEFDEGTHGVKANEWMQAVASKLERRYGTLVDDHFIAGDLNIKRCIPTPEPPENEPHERQVCGERTWYANLRTGRAYVDTIFAMHGESQEELDDQFRDGDIEREKRIDFMFTKEINPALPSLLTNASHDLTCGLEGSTDVGRRNCDNLINTEFYSDHRLLWAFLGAAPTNPGPLPTPIPSPTVGI